MSVGILGNKGHGKDTISDHLVSKYNFHKKAFADPIAFNFIDFTTSKNLRIDEAFDVNAFPEILFLTKYIGDYNISKYGDKLVFENQGFALVVKRT